MREHPPTVYLTGAIEALPTAGVYPFDRSYDDIQMAVAANLIAADLIRTASFDSPQLRLPISTHLRTIFCGNQLLPLAPWFADVGS